MKLDWSEQDEHLCVERGIDKFEIERQWHLLNKNTCTELDRPATIGDGIHRLSPSQEDEFFNKSHQVLSAHMVAKFVPASGAASRMFKHLWEGNSEGVLWKSFFENLEDFPFYHALDRAIGDLDKADGTLEESIVTALSSQLGYDKLPKGLIPFHRYENQIHNAFWEHLHESEQYGLSSKGIQIHFTVGQDWQAEISTSVDDYIKQRDLRFDISYSSQLSSTDTIARTQSGLVLRGTDNHPIFRPGGHGALIQNLNGLRADFVFIKNIDNVRRAEGHKEVAKWKRVLLGYAEKMKSLIDTLLGQSDMDLARAVRLIETHLFIRLPEEKNAIRTFLDRPLRVVGVVKNQGEPGGGPFWVNDQDGLKSLQIVEGAEVASDESQIRILKNATHFNPVDLVCAFKRYDGSFYDLNQFVNQSRSFVASKSHGNQQIKVLEHPGLWNGAMHNWNTVFVEVPLGTFSPVKTVNDLLRPEHQPA